MNVDTDLTDADYDLLSGYMLTAESALETLAQGLRTYGFELYAERIAKDADRCRELREKIDAR